MKPFLLLMALPRRGVFHATVKASSEGTARKIAGHLYAGRATILKVEEKIET